MAMVLSFFALDESGDSDSFVGVNGSSLALCKLFSNLLAMTDGTGDEFRLGTD